MAAAKAAGASSRGRVHDWYAFTLSFKGVLLEGLEVVFIAITFGSSQRDVGTAALAAVAAVVVVAGAGLAVRAPLARVPSAYLREVEAAKTAGLSSRGRVHDWYAFTLSFKGVLLEGLEVVFIVITFGANQRNVGAAVIGAAAAVVVVAVTGVLVRAPLARVPENAMKFAVGIMLTSFGIFWGAEGAGVSWPGHDAALLVLVPVVALVALCYTVLLRRPRAARPASVPASEEVTSS